MFVLFCLHYMKNQVITEMFTHQKMMNYQQVSILKLNKSFLNSLLYILNESIDAIKYLREAFVQDRIQIKFVVAEDQVYYINRSYTNNHNFIN